MSKHHNRNPIKWHGGTGPTASGKRVGSVGRYVRYWRSDVLAWMAAQEAATAKGGVQ